MALNFAQSGKATTGKTGPAPTQPDRAPNAAAPPPLPLAVADALGMTATTPQQASATRTRLMNRDETGYDAALEQSIRPQRLSDYIGQRALKDTLAITLQAAQTRNEPLDHVLLYGPPGLGKTTLAMAVAREMDAEFHLTSAPALERPRDIVGLLMSLKPGSVLFIDEIHRLNKVTEEILYPAMEDFRLDRTVGQGHTAKVLSVPLPKFTLIGATTKAGSIANPLRDRFGMTHRLNYYEPDELCAILHRSARILDIELTDDAAGAIARRCRGTPRIANRLLRRVRDFVTVQATKGDEPSAITPTVADDALNLFHIDADGLDATDRQLLSLMHHQFSGGPVGLDTLAAALGEDARTIEDVVEPYLLQLGLIQRTPRGRMLTPQSQLGLFANL